MTNFRIGNGFDVHKFEQVESTEGIKICGVLVPHTHKLIGHSDADVGLHAIVDAILGALAMGDIGEHFPPSDTRWERADSAIFLDHCKHLLERKKAKIENIDVTIICEAPKITPYKKAMGERIASILKIKPDRVNVKATTTEGLGFTGRREGIAAQASVLLCIPK